MSDSWFYSLENQQYGPITFEALKKKFLDKELLFDNLVWKFGMSEWQPATEIESFYSLKNSPPPLPSNNLHENITSEYSINPPPLPGQDAKSVIPKFLMMAEVQDRIPTNKDFRPWSRYWARFLDSYAYLIMGLALKLLISSSSFDNGLINIFSVIIFLFVVLGGWVFIEAGFLSIFGTTLGKWLFKVTVRSLDGNKLSFEQALKRSVHVWISGEGLGIPILCFFRPWFCYRHLMSMGVTSWDQNARAKVETHHINLIRFSVSVAISLCAPYVWTKISTVFSN
jgi:uncharacterized RDD family membrane protein YckC